MATVTRAIAVAAVLLASGCFGEGAEEASLPQTERARHPQLVEAIEPRGRSLELRVLTYNVEGLPWPIRTSDRGRALRRIGERLGELRANGRAPHVVLLQEAFIRAVRDLIAAAGYPNFVRGPDADAVPPASSGSVPAELRRNRKLLRGEAAGKWIGSGLYILSDFPILAKDARPFSRAACAGWDCMANKGILRAYIRVPGLPAPLQVVTSHLNSRGDAGVSRARSRAAHKAQAKELHSALRRQSGPGMATILGGDFNTKGAPQRFEHFAGDGQLPIVRRICARERRCSVSLPLEGERPWLGAQDLQGFLAPSSIAIRPVEAEIIFEAGKGPDRLSDHDAYMVTYELRWRPGSRQAARGPAPIDAPISNLQSR